MEAEKIDIAVIGAGWSGLAGAKTYLQVHPNAKMVVFDARASIGGAWAAEGLYPGLQSNNLLGTYEYPDFPMTPKTFSVHPRQHIPGRVLHEYLSQYADKFGIGEKVRFKTKVTRAEYDRQQNTWTLTVEKLGDGMVYMVVADKVIMATGVTSEPFIPDISGSDQFNAPIIHFKDLAQHVEAFSNANSSVTVLGGAKAAFDVAYLFGSRGIKVHWVMRASGRGPSWMIPPYLTPLKMRGETLINTRPITWTSPCIWGEADGHTGIRRWLHQTSFGRKVVKASWGILDYDICWRNEYGRHLEMQKLKPWCSVFWIASTLGILNYPTNFFDLIRSGVVQIHISDIDHLSSHAVHLVSEPEPLQTDALICCTGWKFKPQIEFFPKGIERQLGVPYMDHDVKDFADEPLTKKADEHILDRFPSLRDQPTITRPHEHVKPADPAGADAEANRPFRLYRLIAPPSHAFQNSIVFLNAMQCNSVSINAPIQALWAVAYLDQKLPGFSPTTSTITEDELLWDATLTSRFWRWRHPTGYGRRYPDFSSDALPYWDLLLNDLGVANKRKGGLKEFYKAYGPKDYKTIVEEWIAKNRS